MNKTAKVIRWLARILSAAILLFWGYFLIAHLVNHEAQPSRPPVTRDCIVLAAMGISLVGLVAAWKWERTGAVMVLVGCVILAVIQSDIFASLYVLWPIAAVLFFSSWWMHRAAARCTTSGRSS